MASKLHRNCAVEKSRKVHFYPCLPLSSCHLLKVHPVYPAPYCIYLKPPVSVIVTDLWSEPKWLWQWWSQPKWLWQNCCLRPNGCDKMVVSAQMAVTEVWSEPKWLWQNCGLSPKWLWQNCRLGPNGCDRMVIWAQMVMTKMSRGMRNLDEKQEEQTVGSSLQPHITSLSPIFLQTS